MARLIAKLQPFRMPMRRSAKPFLDRTDLMTLLLTNRTMLVAAALASASPAYAEPLTFGAINGADDLSQSSELTGCAPGPESGERTCQLARTSFGGLAVEKGSATLNADGRIRALRIALDERDHDLARNLLAGRYGPPVATDKGTRWTSFDDGASIAIARARPNTLITFDFPENGAVAAPAGPDGRALLFLMLFAAGAIVTGLMLRRRQRPRRAARPGIVPAPQPSMRETLERRLQEGRDLQF